MIKKILITGGAGYIGSHTVLAAMERSHEVAVVDNLSTGVRSAIPEKVLFFEQDIGDYGAMVSILEDFKPDAIIHFAGSVVVPESMVDPIKYYTNNTLATLNLVNACLKTKVRIFIFSSTAAVYGISDKPTVSEDDITGPINPYGRSKLMIEQILADTAVAHDFNYTALRYFNVAGADEQLRAGQSTPNATHLIKVACECAVGLHPCVNVFGTDYDTKDGTGVRDFIHVSDLARAHLDVLNYMETSEKSSVFNCGNGVGYSVNDVLESVQRVNGKPLKIKLKDRREGDTPILIANAEKLRKMTGWVARYKDIDQIVRTSLEWEKKLVS